MSVPSPAPSPDSGVDSSVNADTHQPVVPLDAAKLPKEARTTLTQRWFESRHTKSADRWARVVKEAPTIDDLGQAMARRVPPVVAEYIRGGADHEQTLRDNVEAFRRVRLNPQYAIRLDSVDMSTTVVGQCISLPVLAAPVGSLRLIWPRGEAVAAKAIG